MRPYFSQIVISPWKKGSGDHEFLDFCYFIMNLQKIVFFWFLTIILCNLEDAATITRATSRMPSLLLFMKSLDKLGHS